jgi:hypothetical protein
MCILKNTLEASLKSLPRTFQKIIQKKKSRNRALSWIRQLGKKNSIVGGPIFTSSALRSNTMLGSEMLDSGQHLNIWKF